MNQIRQRLPALSQKARDGLATAAAEARLRAMAFAAVATSTSDDLSETTVASVKWRIGCLAAILLGRRGFKHLDENLPLSDPRCPLHDVKLASFAPEELYAGWRAQFVMFHAGQFRFEIESDGDWNM